MALPSLVLPADKLELLEQLDGWSPLRNRLRELAAERNDWAGIPISLDDLRLVLEPTYPYAKRIMELEAKQHPNPPHQEMAELLTLRNTFWSWHYHRWVSIWECAGKISWTKGGEGNQAAFLLGSLSACDAWGIEQESNAVNLLGRLVTHRQFKHYLLTGMFVEQSKRSGVLYVFRRLRPTIAVTLQDDQPRILCTLCMHPIGYYNDTWAGAMVPTDDVIAHLMLMRGDEHMFWRRANQHSPWEHQAGL